MPLKRKQPDSPGEASPLARKHRRLVQRSQSAPPAPAPSPLPLTRENLHLLHLSLSPATPDGPLEDEEMPPSTIPENRKSPDSSAKLAAHHVYIVGKTHPQPEELTRHIETVVRAARSTAPSAARIARKAPRAAALGEQAAIDLVGSDLLAKSEADGGECYVTSQPKLNLSTTYLPVVDSVATHETGSLSQAQPDTTIGYITVREAQLAGVSAPLSQEQELALVRDPLTSSLHFPFLTCQWKGYTGSEGHHHASLQGARDSACIVNHLHQFYTNAGYTPSVIDTCHFSVTSDMDTAKMWIHWCEEKADGTLHHYMKCIKQAFLNPIEEDDSMALLEGFRKMIRNILEYAIGERLNKLKQVVDTLRKSKEDIYRSTRPKPGSQSGRRSTRGNALLSPPASQTALEAPPRKRLRQDST